jgi:hypothetical protein
VVANALVGRPRSNTSDISVSTSDTSTVPPANTAGNAAVLGSSGRQHHPVDDQAMPPNPAILEARHRPHAHVEDRIRGPRPPVCGACRSGALPPTTPR